MNRKLGFCACIAVVLLWTLPVGAAPFKVTLEANAVLVSGMTPKGEVALLGVTREIAGDDFPVVRRHLEVLADEDGDGAIRYPVEEGVPPRSLWAVADLASGDYDVASPEKFGSRRVNWRGRGVQRRNDGKDVIEDQRTILEFLVVRPQVGAWALRVRDGNESDEDGVIDGRLEGTLEKMTPLAASPRPPSVFQRDDLVLALDPAAMEIT
ncbi:MAG TPA: hypothetical protein VLE27_14680, partial [Thermoanaerobaculia bacterium]|nr:hypothetical protein [Thermoanaerobaculia bacterium]